MRNLARKQEHKPEVFQELGAVIRTAGAAFVVRTSSGEFEARRAASCLLEPAPGDEVLVAVAADRAYVLAVLEREAGAPGSIVADGDLDIKLPRGRFGVAAQEGVSLVSAKDVSVVSSSVNVRAAIGEVALQRFSFVSALVRAEVEKAKVLAGSLDSVLDRFSQRVKRAYRVVEESDHLRAERVDYAAKETMNLHGGNTVITAEELVKLEGEQIHIG